MKLLFVTLFVAVTLVKSFAGDTTTVRSHNKEHWSWYGQIDRKAGFPAAGGRYQKITMHYTLGCPSQGCSDWDYTTKIEALHYTGRKDSTLESYPSYTVNGTVVTPFNFNTHAVYTYTYNNTTQLTDSAIAPQQTVLIFSDTLNPQTATDTLMVYPGNYYNYIYNSSGQKTDSIFVGADSTWQVKYTKKYRVFDEIQTIELGRFITPYAGNLSGSWSRTIDFDVTDYAPVLHDSVTIRAFYSGWSDGFTITLDFEFINGVPPRDPLSVENVWEGDLTYGYASDPINNHLPARKFKIANNVSEAELRVTPTGHGFNNTGNCAEFCKKSYYIKVNGTQYYSQLIWRDDCGLNAQYPQPGTWLYDRANWCPGAKGRTFIHNLSPYIIPGDSVSVDMDLQAYTNSSATSPASYTIESQLITYGAKNYVVNAELTDIVSPSNKYDYKRQNPICNDPQIIIKNLGSQALTSLDINYNVRGGAVQQHHWTGNLNFLDTAWVTLPGNSSLYVNSTSDTFEVSISNPNNAIDENQKDNKGYSKFTKTTNYNYTKFRLLVGTNNAGGETSYTVSDDRDSIIYNRQFLGANLTFIDSFEVNPGCYTITIKDEGCDGLSFWDNTGAGTGYANLYRIGKNVPIYYFPTDFGCEYKYSFTNYDLSGIQDVERNENKISCYPNPASNKVFADGTDYLGKAISIQIFAMNGSLVRAFNKNTTGTIVELDITGIKAGVYSIHFSGEMGIVRKKLVVVK